jgi:hypothetical protein
MYFIYMFIVFIQEDMKREALRNMYMYMYIYVPKYSIYFIYINILYIGKRICVENLRESLKLVDMSAGL